MHNLILYCKSYRGDFQRLVNLSLSIKEFNKDNIPFYISVPESDLELAKESIPYYTEIITDEGYTPLNEGWRGQQYTKAYFYKTKISRFYVSIDSDSYFFKDFYTSDFLVNDKVPYLVMSDGTSFYEWWDRFANLFPFDARETNRLEALSIKEHLGSGGKIWDFSPSPFIWDTQVWEWLDTNYGIHKLFEKHCNELKWYGEGAIVMGADFFPTSPLFACMHYPQQYQFYKQLGWEEIHFKNQYLGMVMQSNWGAPLKF